jgi:cell division protein FtsZ
MSFSFDLNNELRPKIIVFGVGGAGGNAVNNMIEAGLEGVEFWVGNTDAQALNKSIAPNKIQLGIDSTMGLGAGSNPEVGSRAAKESIEQISAALEGCNMVFITAGMGGGTGTGAAPVIAALAKEKGILTVGVVTKPFHFEGARRMKISEMGLEAMSQNIDTLIVIPNQNLFHLANEKTTFADAFMMADKILDSGVRGISELITTPGAINLDFADIRAVMSEMGKAMMCTGEAEGENRAIKAAESAISNPLLDSASMRGAKGVLINITGSYNMTLYEIDEAANRIREEADPDANIIFGSAFNQDLGDKIRVSIVATGINNHYNTSTNKLDSNIHVQQTQLNHSSQYNVPITIEHHQNVSNKKDLNDNSAQQLNVNCDPKRKERSFLNKDNLQDVRDKGAFVPSSTQHKVEGYEGFASNTANINHPNDSEEINEKKNLFSRMSANFSRMTTSDSSIDIPAILRRGDNKSEG